MDGRFVTTGVQPCPVGRGRHPIAVTMGGDSTGHTCVLLDDRSVKCWGANRWGQTGSKTSPAEETMYPQDIDVWDTSTDGDCTEPVDLGAGKYALQLSAGGGSTCALLNDWSVRCWGLLSTALLQQSLPRQCTRCNAGTAGVGDAVPLLYTNGERAYQVVTGVTFTCVLLQGGKVRCAWSGLTYPRNPTGITFSLSRKAVSVASNAQMACAHLEDGSIYCWGYPNPNVKNGGYVGMPPLTDPLFTNAEGNTEVYGVRVQLPPGLLSGSLQLYAGTLCGLWQDSTAGIIQLRCSGCLCESDSCGPNSCAGINLGTYGGGQWPVPSLAAGNLLAATGIRRVVALSTGHHATSVCMVYSGARSFVGPPTGLTVKCFGRDLDTLVTKTRPTQLGTVTSPSELGGVPEVSLPSNMYQGEMEPCMHIGSVPRLT